VAWDADIDRARREEVERAEDVRLEVRGLERQEEMRAAWERGTGDLVAVKEGIGGTVAKLEKARAAVEYLKNQ